MSAGREQYICLQYARFHKRCISLSPACLLRESGHLLFLLRRRVSAEKKKRDILQIRTTTKRNDFSCHASVSNQSSSCSESKLTEWCHHASPRAPPGCAASRSLSDSNTGVWSPQLRCSDPVCSLFRAFHRWCLSGGHVHFWRDAGFSFLSQAGCSQ